MYVQEIKKRLSGKKGQFFPIKTDLTKEEDILNAFKWVEQNLDGLHLIVNNAGIVQFKTIEGKIVSND